MPTTRLRLLLLLLLLLLGRGVFLLLTLKLLLEKLLFFAAQKNGIEISIGLLYLRGGKLYLWVKRMVMVKEKGEEGKE